MKRLLVAVVLLWGLAMPVFAQETLVGALAVSDFNRTWSVEVGTGYAPIHITALSGSSENKSRASSGQYVTDLTPLSFTLAGVMRTSERWEMKLIADFAWQNCAVMQFDTFGVDPDGQPRYKIDYQSAQYVGRINTDFVWSLTFMFRRIWNPAKDFQLYSEFGLGVLPQALFYSSFFGDVYVIPSVTPIGARYCWNHIYLFAEIPLGPYATLIHGGLGWNF